MHRLRGNLTYANVMATIAVFIALGGASYAAIKLPKNSVGTRQIKAGAVTGAKIKKGAVSAANLAPGAIPGTDINPATLGTVPSATNAAHAVSADTATNANALGGIPASDIATNDVVRTATISAKGILNPDRSVGITQANVLHKETGIYCINGLSPAPKTSFGAPTFGGETDADIITKVGNEPDCQTTIIVYGGPASNPTDQPFAILLR